MLCISLAQDYQQTLSHKEPSIKETNKSQAAGVRTGSKGHPRKNVIGRSEGLLWGMNSVIFLMSGVF